MGRIFLGHEVESKQKSQCRTNCRGQEEAGSQVLGPWLQGRL